MAFNQAGFFLVPPRYGAVFKTDPSAKTASGTPLVIVSTELLNPAAPKVLAGNVRQWLFDRGFKEKERYGDSQILCRGQHTTALGAEDEIDLTLPFTEDEIHGLRLRFLLTENTPHLFPEWKAFALELGDDFGFRLMDAGGILLPCIDFPTLLFQNENFCALQKSYGWQL